MISVCLRDTGGGRTWEDIALLRDSKRYLAQTAPAAAPTASHRRFKTCDLTHLPQLLPGPALSSHLSVCVCVCVRVRVSVCVSVCARTGGTVTGGTSN